MIKTGESLEGRQTALPLITRHTPKQSIRAHGLRSIISGTHLSCPRTNWHLWLGSQSTVAQASSRGTQRAQHSPSWRNGTSPEYGWQTGAAHKIPAQGSGRHCGQHLPSGTWRLTPTKSQRGGLEQLTVEQGWQTGQHSPSGTTLISPAWHCRSAGQRSNLHFEPPPRSDAPGYNDKQKCT